LLSRELDRNVGQSHQFHDLIASNRRRVLGAGDAAERTAQHGIGDNRRIMEFPEQRFAGKEILPAICALLVLGIPRRQ
jgi:hypothetical protein